MWEYVLSTLSPISWTFLFWNSSHLLARATNSVVHTGVKSAGWLNRITHLPLKSDSLIFAVSAHCLEVGSELPDSRDANHILRDFRDHGTTALQVEGG